MITLTFNTPYTQFTTQVNDYYTTIFNEIQRKKHCQHLDKEFKRLFKTKKSLFYFYLNTYIYNLNKTDPVICTDIPAKLIQDYLQLPSPPPKATLDKFNKLSKELIAKIATLDISKEPEEILVINKGDSVQLKTVSHGSETVTINKVLYTKLLSRDPSVEKAFLIIYRYEYLGLLTGIQGSVNPIIYDKLNKQFTAETELFASAFNVTLPKYFGLFYDLEKTYGCFGNFFNASLTKGFYVANPPFIVTTMNLMIRHINDFFKNEKAELSIYITVPVWDIADRKRLNKICKLKMPTDYDNDMITDQLHKNTNTVSDTLWCKENYTYYEHITKKSINYTATNVFLLSNKYKQFNFKYPADIAKKPINYE